MYVSGSSHQVHCEHLGLSYVKCGRPPDLDSIVDGAIEACFSSLAPAGPELKKGEDGVVLGRLVPQLTTH